MSIKLKGLIVICFLIIFALILEGCENEDVSEKIVGCWKLDIEQSSNIDYNDPIIFDTIFVFKEDKTGYYDVYGTNYSEFVYKVDGSKVSIRDSKDEENDWITEKCKISGDTMIIENENGIQIFNRVPFDYVSNIKYLKDDLDYAERVTREVFLESVSLVEDDIVEQGINDKVDAKINDIKIFNLDEEIEAEYENLGKNIIIVKITYDANYGGHYIHLNGVYDEETGQYRDNTAYWMIGPLVTKYGVHVDLTEDFLNN